MTYRERREAKAARLEQWAEKRQTDATRQLNSQPELRHDWAFITQPGRIIARERMNRADDRAYQSLNKAREMTSRASGIADQLDRSIYSDDPDAIERLRERITELRAELETRKAANVAYRKAHAAELKALTAFGRNQAVPFPTYAISNLGADIRRNEQRLAQLTVAADGSRPLRVIQAHRAGDCDRCTQPINAGDWIGKYADGWSHVSGTPWARCAE